LRSQRKHATIHDEVQIQVASNGFALCNDCQIKSDIYMDWCIFSISSLYTQETQLLPDTARHGQFSTTQFSTPIHNSTNFEYARQLKCEGTVPLVIGPTVITLHRTVPNATII
jgi:hypothetical protein